MPAMKCKAIAVWLMLGAPLAGAEIPVADPGEVAAAVKKAQPGDVITLANGEYRSEELLFSAEGTAERPIVLRAATPGKVIFRGTSRLRISGSHLVVEGFYYYNAFHPEGLITLRRDSRREAHHCRVTQCGIVDCNPSAEETSGPWIAVFGTHNRVDHCLIQGKAHGGPSVAIWIPSDQTSPNQHQIDHNYFGPRPPLRLQRNGEALRLGQSTAPTSASRILVEANLFDRCAGGIDVINNFASDSAFRSNVFLRSAGSLSLRSCNHCLVQSNYFIGANVSASGGVRISGEEHTIAGNYFSNLAGTDELAALAVMDGYGHAQGNGYLQAKRCTLADNVILECAQTIAIGLPDRDAKRRAGSRLPPEDCTLSGNVVYGSRGLVVDQRSNAERMTWRGNIYSGGDLGIGSTPDAWAQFQINLGVRDGVPWPQHPAVRGPQLAPLRSAEVGPAWYSLAP